MLYQKQYTLENGGKLELGTGAIKSSDGSASFSQGSTTVLVGVNGPVEVKTQKELIDRAYLDVNYKTKSGQPKVDDRAFEQAVSTTFDKAIITKDHPRTSICLNIQEMMNDGGLLACAINATCLALIDAGIPMSHLVAASQCIITEDDEIIANPDKTQIEGSKFNLTLAVDSIASDIITLISSGTATIKELKRCIEESKVSSIEKLNFMRMYMSER